MQQKIFYSWLLLFILTVIISVATRQSVAINSAHLLLIILGLMLALDSIVHLYFRLIILSWPKTTFKVKHSEIQHISDDSDKNSRWKANFELEYEVNGHSYPKVNHEFNDPIHATEIVADLYVKEVCDGIHGTEVYYNPQSPDEAYINPGIEIGYLSKLVLGIVVIIIPTLSMSGYLIWR